MNYLLPNLLPYYWILLYYAFRGIAVAILRNIVFITRAAVMLSSGRQEALTKNMTMNNLCINVPSNWVYIPSYYTTLIMGFYNNMG